MDKVDTNQNECVIRAYGERGWVEVRVCLNIYDLATRRESFAAALNGLFAAVDTQKPTTTKSWYAEAGRMKALREALDREFQRQKPTTRTQKTKARRALRK